MVGETEAEQRALGAGPHSVDAATLRPYQRVAVNWLAFLRSVGLGAQRLTVEIVQSQAARFATKSSAPSLFRV